MTVTWDRAALSSALQRVAAGDEMALKEVYDHTSAKLFGICLRILKTENEAEDVLQEVYLSIWRRAGTFDDRRSSPITWLAAMARNRAIDRLRSNITRLRETELDGLEPPDPTPSALSGMETYEELMRLESCLAALEAPQRQAVRTAFFEGITYDALAQRMNVPLGTMKGWIRRSLMSLRTCLEA